MNVTPPAFHGYFKYDDGKDISDETLERLAEALEVPKKELLKSEQENVRLEYRKAMYEYFLTKRGALTLLSLAAFGGFISYVYKDGIVTLLVSLVVLLSLDYTGLIHTKSNGIIEVIMDKISLFGFRALEGILMFTLVANAIMTYMGKM